MRIAFVADTFTGDVGGGVTAGRHFVERLRSEHEVIVIGADVDRAGDVAMRSFQFPIRAMRDMGFVMAVPERRRLAEVMRRVDVVHLQFPFWLSFVAAEEAKKAGRPVVAAFHVQPENVFMNIGVSSAWAHHALYRFWVERFYQQADVVICPSHFARRKLEDNGLRVPIHVISNGVPDDVDPTKYTHRPLGDGRPFSIVAVGRFAAEKRQDLIIEAVRASRHSAWIHLILAGAGPEEAEVRRLAASLPGGTTIGFLAREDLLRALAEADLFVHASEVELEGIAVMEAMRMGTPVLVADGPESTASAFALGDELRFPVGDVRALTARIDALLDHPEQLEALRSRHRDIGRAFTLDLAVPELVAVYRSLIGSTGSTASS